jgi:carboxynorspermidine decarboxylase
MTLDVPAHALDQAAPRFDIDAVESPAFVVDQDLLRANLETLARVQDRAGCRILLALKGFAMFATFPLLRQYLAGCCASGLNEALLAHHEFGGEVHVYSPTFKEKEVRRLLPIAHHISFNSLQQWRRFRPMIDQAGSDGCHAPSPGLRVNPEHSEVEVPLYDPCSPDCRLGARSESLQGEDLDGLEGLHFHALCEQDSDVLERMIDAVETRFPRLLSQVSWVNMGGGHHITRRGYGIDRLVGLITRFRERWNKDVFLEPGEAVALNTGYLVASVVDIVQTGDMQTALVDVSATAHMPDTLEMPYRPHVFGSGMPGEFAHNYRLGGPTCLAGDVVNVYSFPKPLRIGQKMAFADMAHYTMVKTTTFNGVPHPDIVLFARETGLQVVRRFGYEDFRDRLS